MTTITFNVPGPPQGKGRPRIVKHGKFSALAAPTKTVAYEGLIALAAAEAMQGRPLIAGPVMLTLTICHAVPASWSKRKQQDALAGLILPTSKPDIDNVLKAVGDGCNGVVWEDDRLIARCTIVRQYRSTPCLAVTVTAL